MSGQQPPHGPPPQQPPHGGPPPQGPPYGQPPYGQPPYGPPQGPPPGGGWQQLPQQPGPKPRSTRSGATVLVAGLAALVVVFAALSAYLWFFDDSGSGSAPNASTAEVDLPDELGDYTVQEQQSDDEYTVDLEQTREDYEEIVGAGFDTKTYVPAGEDAESGGSGDPREITVQATRADLPLTPYYTTETSSTEIVRDDLICHLAYYEGYDPDAENGESSQDDKEQLPQSCSRSGDGLTVYVNTYSTSVDEDPPTLDELVELTDEAYDAAK